MEIIFEQGQKNDIDDIEILYNDINDYLACTKNYPGWRKGIYPDRQTAIDGTCEQCLYVIKFNKRIIASAILRHKPELAYQNVKWTIDLEYKDILVIYTFCVHPDYLGQGIGTELMKFIFNYSKEQGIKAIRLDVYIENKPAICFYKKCGFQYIDTVDLGLGQYGLKYFELYEKLI